MTGDRFILRSILRIAAAVIWMSMGGVLVYEPWWWLIFLGAGVVATAVLDVLRDNMLRNDAQMEERVWWASRCELR